MRVGLTDRVGEAVVDGDALSDEVAEADREILGDTVTVTVVEGEALDDMHTVMEVVDDAHSDGDGEMVGEVEAVAEWHTDVLGDADTQDDAV